MQTAAIRTVAKSLPENEVILLTLLISKRYIPYTDLRKILGKTSQLQQIFPFTQPKRYTSKIFHILNSPHSCKANFYGKR